MINFILYVVYNINYHIICCLFLILFVIIIVILQSFDYIYNNQLLFLKSFAKESKEKVDEDEESSNKKLIQQQQLALKEMLGISSPSSSSNTNTTDTIIPQIYPSKINSDNDNSIGEEFRLNKTNPNDMIQMDETKRDYIFTKQNKDGSWRIDEGRPRIDIFTKDAGILSNKQILQKNLSKSGIQSWNYSELKDIGYWYKPSDWKNVEVTLIFKLLDSARSKGEEHALSIVTRSITHSQLDKDYKKSDDEPKYFCGGSSYHNNISNEGQVRMKKEELHVDYEREEYNLNMNLGNLYNKIIGFKAIVYNINSTAVKMESWVDVYNEGKGPYVKLHQKIDKGNWGNNMKVCDAYTNGQAITWGSPMIIIKSNDFKFDLYDIEVREIIPPNTK